MMKMDQYQRIGGLNWQFPQVLVNLYFQQDLIKKLPRGAYLSKENMKLYHATYVETLGGSPPRETTCIWHLGPPSLLPMPTSLWWAPPISSFWNVPLPPPRIASTPSLKSVWSNGLCYAPTAINIVLHPSRGKPSQIRRAKKLGTLIHISTRI
jgi:hypothetical protein